MMMKMTKVIATAASIKIQSLKTYKSSSSSSTRAKKVSSKLMCSSVSTTAARVFRFMSLSWRRSSSFIWIWLERFRFTTLWTDRYSAMRDLQFSNRYQLNSWSSWYKTHQPCQINIHNSSMFLSRKISSTFLKLFSTGRREFARLRRLNIRIWRSRIGFRMDIT